MADEFFPSNHNDLRGLVASVVREVMAGRTHGDAAAEPRSRLETVRIRDDADLHAFALRLLGYLEDAESIPTIRENLQTGRLRFRLDAGRTPVTGGSHSTLDDIRRIERGAVTERAVVAAADAGVRLVLGHRAVLTPLARDKARKLGVAVDKERS